jgi:hypothetical protein
MQQQQPLVRARLRLASMAPTALCCSHAVLLRAGNSAV